ncbi:MAG: tRNA1(Val) (adenine(37)-N6)-methyltransferase [Leadbetterella sp.]
MFRFKKFTIRQEKTAMKVCTDSCVFGAYIEVNGHQDCLDIGTGTGLLSLMVAQRNLDLEIDAVEINEDACQNANQNFIDSPFAKRINLHFQPLQEYVKTANKQFDLIISNPPFYEESLKSPFNNKNQAFHNENLDFETLANCCNRLLLPDGKLWILLPPESFDTFKKIIQNQTIFLEKELNLYHSTDKKLLRKIGCFSRIQSTIVDTKTLYIYNSDAYTEEFRLLLKDYYLKF